MDWPESCQSNIYFAQGPLDISSPFTSIQKTLINTLYNNQIKYIN